MTSANEAFAGMDTMELWSMASLIVATIAERRSFADRIGHCPEVLVTDKELKTIVEDLKQEAARDIDDAKSRECTPGVS